jgi:hypothetical protein
MDPNLFLVQDGKGLAVEVVVEDHQQTHTLD